MPQLRHRKLSHRHTIRDCTFRCYDTRLGNDFRETSLNAFNYSLVFLSICPQKYTMLSREDYRLIPEIQARQDRLGIALAKVWQLVTLCCTDLKVC